MQKNKRNKINDKFQMKTMNQSETFQYVIDKVQDSKHQKLIFSRTNIIFKSNKTSNRLLDRIEQVMHDIHIKSSNRSKEKDWKYIYFQAKQQQGSRTRILTDVYNI